MNKNTEYNDLREHIVRMLEDYTPGYVLTVGFPPKFDWAIWTKDPRQGGGYIMGGAYIDVYNWVHGWAAACRCYKERDKNAHTKNI